MNIREKMIVFLFLSFYISLLVEEQWSMQGRYEGLAVQYQEFLREIATNQNECMKEKAAIDQTKIEYMAKVTKYEDTITNGLETKLNDLRYI